MKIIELRPPRIALALAVAAALIHLILPPGASARLSAPPAGAAIGAAGFLLTLWAWLLFRKMDIAVCPLAGTARITTEGPYRFTRNPMYLGMVLMLSGLALFAGTVPFYAAAAAFLAVMDKIFCPYEEAKLEAGFGETYEDYRRRVRRWL